MRWLRVLSICMLAVAAAPGPGGVERPSAAAPDVAAAAAPAVAPPAAQTPAGPVDLVFTGDVNLGGRVGDVISARGAAYPWQSVSELLRTADLAVINLECAVSYRGAPEDKEYVFRGDPAAVPAMAAAGVDVASVANNHAMDFGPDAFSDTLGHLRAAGIAPAGGGLNATEAWRPVVFDQRGMRIAFVAASRVLPAGFGATDFRPGVASAYDEGRLIQAVRQSAAEADFVVVLVHWGVELATQPNGVQIGLARALAAAGARVIIGHHPHVLQPVEWVDGALVAYSLGNFVFSPGSPAGAASMMLRVTLHPDGRIEFSTVPVRIVDRRPILQVS